MGKNYKIFRGIFWGRLMGIVAADILIKTMLEASIADLRKNSWIVEDIFSMLAQDFLASKDYGLKEVEAASDWFLNNEIPILLAYRIADTAPVPCITISYNENSEAMDRTSLADQRLTDSFDPTGIVTNAKNLTPVFSVESYDPLTGIITVPDSISLANIRKGQFLVANKANKAYVIYDIIDNYSFKIKEGIVENFSKAHIRTKFGTWNLEQEISFINENYTLGCHANGAGPCLWLWQIITYCLLRYKEAYLEGRLFELSRVQSSAIQKNNNFPADNVFSRYITLSGTVPATWIKYAAPRLEVITAQVIIADGPNKSPEAVWNGYTPRSSLSDPISPDAPSWQVTHDFEELSFIGDGMDEEDA